jgi:uncharacterized protein
MVQDEVTFYGHSNVQSLHARTIEITKDDYLTPRGDCIIGIRADKACADLNQALKNRLRRRLAIVRIEVIVGMESFSITGKGDERLELLSSHDIVIRKSNFICPRTLSVRTDSAALEMPRKMVKMLQDKDRKAVFRITVD